MAKKEKEAVVKGKGKQLARPEDLKDELRRFATDDAARMPTSTGDMLSIKGKEFKLKGAVLDSPLDVIALDYAFENAWYDSDYDEDTPRPPACFAVGKVEKELVPHESSPKPQAESCKECELNKFGSGDKGRGKACKNGAKVAVIAASVKRLDDEYVKNAEPAFMRLPPTSLKHLNGHVKKLSGMELPMFATISQLDFDEDESYPVVTFQYNGEVDGTKVLRALIDKRETVQDELTKGFDTTNYQDPDDDDRRGKKGKLKKGKKDRDDDEGRPSRHRLDEGKPPKRKTKF